MFILMVRHTILFLAANPIGTDRLALDREYREIQVALESSSRRDCFELKIRSAAEPDDLLDQLRKLNPTVVHFSGHGAGNVTGERDLIFHRADGGPQVVSIEAVTDS